jgi:translocation and assembly module TamB
VRDVDLDGFRGAVTYAPDVLEADVAHPAIVARKIAGGADVAGTLTAHVKEPGDARGLPDARLAWEGAVGRVAQTVRASFVNGVVDAVVDVPEADPAMIRSVWPASTLERPARVHLEAHGPLAGTDVTLRANVGDAALDARGHLVLDGEKWATLTMGVHDVDLHDLAPSAPRSRIGLNANAVAEIKPDGALSADVALRFAGGTIGGNAAPPASLNATLSRSATKELRAQAELVVDEPSAPTHATVNVVPRGKSSAVDFRVDSNVDDFQRVPVLGHGVYGKARLSASGDVDLASRVVDAHLQAQASRLARGTTRVEGATVVVHARGALDRPVLDAAVHARGVAAVGRRFASVDLAARGQATAPHVEASVRGPDTPDVDAQADLGLAGGLSMNALRVALARAGERAVVTARHAKLGGGDAVLDDATIVGLGEPLTATLAMTPATLRVRASTKGVDLGRVARLAHLENSVQSGTLSFDTDLHVRRGAGDGHVTIDVARGSASNAKNVTAHADVALAGRSMTADVHADLPGIAVVDLTVPKLTVAGAGALTHATWREVFGSLDLDARVDLARVAALVPPADLPLSEAHGEVVLAAHLARDDLQDVTPGVRLEATTKDLILAPRVPQARDIDGVLVHPQPTWRLAGVDFAIDGDVNDDTGALRLAAKAHDAKGSLAELDAKAEHLPYADVLRGGGHLATDLRAAKLDLKLTVPERGLGELPQMLRQHIVGGHVRADVSLRGTMLEPMIDASVAIRRASFSGDVTDERLDVELAGHYDGHVGTTSVKASSGGAELLDIEAKVAASMRDIVEGGRSAPPWSASLRGHMDGFPLQSIAALDDKLVAGKLSGDVTLANLHEDAHVDANLSIAPLSVGSLAYKSATAVVKVDGRAVDATVRVEQSDGFAETKAHAAASWGAAVAPSLDPANPLEITLAAKNFRIAALLPFLDGILDELDGRVDADTHVELDPRVNGAKLNGTFVLSRGTIESPAGGGELHDVAANVRFAPDGTISLDRFVAYGATGHIDATATAHLDGLALRSVKAELKIPGNAAIPLTAGGTEIGNIDGSATITATGAAHPGGAMDVKVVVPKLNVKLPEAATGNPQALEPMDKDVRVGAHRGNPARFVLLPLDPKQPKSDASKSGGGLAIATHLGDVHVARGKQVAVDLDGDLSVSADGAPKVTGQIRVKKGGTLDVQGRTFAVENGTVTFVDDPTNPQVVVKASWKAPDGTIVYATFTGPLRTGKVTLSSEPTLSRDEIVQLLLFGSADGRQAQTPTSNTETSAIATAGGAAAQPLNHMLDQIGLGAVSAKVDTSESANPKPEVEVQIAKQLSVDIAVVLGQPPPGVNPDRTLVTLDWRFLSKWSLATTVGDAGTTIFDLLWQHRY